MLAKFLSLKENTETMKLLLKRSGLFDFPYWSTVNDQLAPLL
jgi:hypothetical protein